LPRVVAHMRPNQIRDLLIATHASPTSELSEVIYFVSAAVAVDSSCMTASSNTSWSRFSPPSNGHVSTTSFMVCRWPQSQEGDWARPHFVHELGLDLPGNDSSETMYDEIKTWRLDSGVGNNRLSEVKRTKRSAACESCDAVTFGRQVS